MGDAVTLSFLATFQGWVFDKLAKYGIGWASKKARDWTNKQLEYRLKIIDKPEAILQNLNETGAYLWITVHVWSSMPLKLKLEKVMGAIETEGYEAKIDWDRTVEKISHHKIQNIEIGKNSWAFSVCVPIQVLKKRVSKSWCLTFVAVFENKAARTFTDIKFKIRDSDIKRIQETLIEEN
jgi:hypothetical protein